MEETNILQVIFSFGLVLGLIGLFALVLRHFANKPPQWMKSSQTGRLQVIESRMLDARRRLVLIRRDNQEHLLLLSPQGEQVIERIEHA